MYGTTAIANVVSWRPAQRVCFILIVLFSCTGADTGFQKGGEGPGNCELLKCIA